MDMQRFAIDARVIGADDDRLQDALARAHESPARARCLCVPGGVEMYVAHHRKFVIKRMPGTGDRHHPECPSFEPAAGDSGLGEIIGDAVIEVEPGRFELRVDFPWVRVQGRKAAGGESRPEVDVERSHRRLSLRALMHFLFERAGFNRWSPAMAGKRNQAVLHRHLTDAAEGVVVKGETLAARLYVPEAFSESRMAEVAQRRRAKLAVLQPRAGQLPLALVLGEFKACETTSLGRRIWIRHMPDAPLLVETRTWERIGRVNKALFEAHDAHVRAGVRLVMAALIRSRSDHTYELDAANLMLTSEQWIPLEGVHELPLVQALVAQQRRFVKPLRYDAGCVAGFANALLLDAGPVAVPLHVLSAFMHPAERAAKERAIQSIGAARAWVWRIAEAMPPLPKPWLGDRRCSSAPGVPATGPVGGSM